MAGSSQSSAASAANEALTDNPSILNSPSLARDAINSPNPSESAMTLAHVSQVSALQEHLSKKSVFAASEEVWQKMFNKQAKIVAGGLNWIGKGLEETKRDYRFIHSVYTKQGIFDGLVATGLVAGGAFLGSSMGPGGTALGATLVATALRKGEGGTIYKESLKDSEDPNYKVSAGRDLSNLISLIPGAESFAKTDKGLGKVTSGLGDVGFTFATDPFIKVLQLRSAVRSGDYLIKGKLIKATNLAKKMLPPTAVDNFFQRNSLRITSTDQLEKLYQSGKGSILTRNPLDTLIGSAGSQYHRGLNELADTANSPNGVGAIVSKYPGLQNMAKIIAPAAGKKVTAEDIHKLFLRATFDKDFQALNATSGINVVPNRTVLRAAVSKFSDSLKQSGGVNDALYLKANQPGFLIPRRGQQMVIDPITGGSIPDGKGVSAITPVAYRAIQSINPFSKQSFKDVGESMKAAVAGKVRTFSGYIPYEIKDDLKAIARKFFDPNGSQAPLIVYRISRFSMGERMARQKVSEFVAGDVGQRKDIYSGLMREMLKAAGVIDDPAFVKKLGDKIQMHIDTPLEYGNYGWGETLGTQASIASTAKGKILQGVDEGHIGEFAIPDFREVKLAMRQVNAYGALYGKIDDFAAKYTDNVFKPLALLTAGFGFRIAASEVIPQIFRFGLIDVAKAKVAGAAAKMNYNLIKGEEDAIIQNATLALSGGTSTKASDWIKAQEQVSGKNIRKKSAKFLSQLGTERDMELAARISIATRGHMATGATLTGKGVYGDTNEQVAQHMNLYELSEKRKYQPTGEFINYVSGDSLFPIQYAAELKRSSQYVSKKSIATDLYNALKSGVSGGDARLIAQRKEYARILKKEYDPTNPTWVGRDLAPGKDSYHSERTKLAGFGNEEPMAFAFRRTDITNGLFAGPDGEINMDILEKFIKGEKITIDEIRNTPIHLLPQAVAGQKFELVPPENLLSSIITNGFEKIIDPIINNLSRQPLFFNHVKNELASLDEAVAKGFFSEEEALRFAMTRATHAMIPQIHNVALRTQFGVLVRNYLPFYFAQEQAMRRAGALITTNPAAFRQYQLIEHGLNEPGFVEIDSNGSKNLNFPILGEFGAATIQALSFLGLPVVTGLPVSVTGNLESLKTVLPEFSTPGVSPFVSIALNALGTLDPTLDRQIRKVTGGAGYNRSLIDQLIPNSPMRNAFKALNANENESSFYNAILSSLASAQYHGQMPSANASPTEKQAFIDRLKNNARSILWMKALVSTWSPLAPRITQEDLGLRDEFYALMKQKSEVTGENMTFTEALGEFLYTHGDSAISYTVGKSESVVKGALTPYTNEAINWIEDNKKLIDSKNGTGAMFLVPQTTTLEGDAQAIHDEVLKMHLRSKRTPEEFMKAIYVAAGNNYIYSQKPTHDKAMEDLKAAGLSQQNERAGWSAFTKAYGQMNPIWQADYASPERSQNAIHAVEQLQDIFSSANPPKGKQVDLVRGLLADWVTHATALQNNSEALGQNWVTGEKDAWSKYLDTLVTKEPRLNAVINSVFRRLS